MHRLADPTARLEQQLQIMLAAGRRARPGKRDVTKSFLLKFRVDELRGHLEAVGADTRGNKDALVERLLEQLRELERARPLAPLDDFQDG